MPNIRRIEKRLTALEGRVDRIVNDADSIHESIAKHVGKLEKRFAKMDKHTKKMKKQMDPRQLDRNTMKLVDQALKAYDKQKGRR